MNKLHLKESKIDHFIQVYKNQLEKREMIVKLTDSFIIVWFDTNDDKYQILVNPYESIEEKNNVINYDICLNSNSNDFLSV
ncbi:hypothetical protein [Oceanobacillus timonensis]|uniref:hypothetical protein n=1 Tax=Oceanobacillus timonensis TaxID=1926285 RepID=UPI0009BC2E5C|nr:hypothetical protein [Oceanobacillus timonensis]